MVKRADTGSSREGTTDPQSPLVLTFMFADIRGWTRFTRERGAAGAGRLAQTFADLARDAAEARGGEVFELRGDEADAVFDSPTQAVRAAVELQETFAEVIAEDPTLPLLAGIGIDVGEVVRVESGFRGSPLNMAGRLCSIAAAGQVLASPAVAAHAGDVEGIVFQHGGTATLKGFEGATPFLEVVTTRSPSDVKPSIDELDGQSERELETDMPLVGRDHEMRWARGTWRRVRRGRGQVLCISGPTQIGKTRLAGEITAHVEASGGAVRYAGAGGTAIADALAAVHVAAETEGPTLVILDDVDVVDGEVATELAGRLEAIESKPVLVLLLAQDPDSSPQLAELVQRVDVRGDGQQHLSPLDQDGVNEIGRAYVGDDIQLAPVESFFRSSGGVPGRIHEVVGTWAREEATRRLSAAAEWLVAGRARRAGDLEFANNILELKLDQLFRVPDLARDGITDVCPYKGLAAFKDEDAALFFGRERLVGELAARSVDVGLLGVVGASGSGKSSAVAAGLLPSLAAGLLPGSEEWQQVSMRPGEHPMTELRTTLGEGDLAGSTIERLPSGSRLVLVVDQFEEIFTTCSDDEERDEFVQAITRAALSWPDDVLVLPILRSDFYGECASFPDLAGLIADNHVLVGPMSKDELRRAIELPARRVGLRVESALTEHVLADVADEPGGLPLISTALVELWQQREGGWLRSVAYERTGGVRGAVARLAEGTYAELSDVQKETAPGVFLRLAGPGEGEAVTRRRVPVAEFDLDRSQATADVILRFTADRLLTVDDGSVEVAHEALIREWPRLEAWLAEDVQGHEIRNHLTVAARTWEDSGEEDSELYRGARLSASLDWSSMHVRQLNDLERRFLTAGRQAGDREVERQRRTNRRLRGLLVGVALFLVLALVAGSVALVQRSHVAGQRAAAEAQALTADAQRLGAQALTEPNLDKAMLMAVAGVRLEDNPQTRASLLATLERSPTATRLIRPSTTSISSMAVSADGSLLASVDSAHVLRFESLPTLKPSAAPITLNSGDESLYRGTAFSADGRTLIVGAGPDLYSIDVATQTKRLLASWSSRWSVRDVAFSPDGSRIMVALGDYSGQGPAVPGRLALIDATSGHTVWLRPYPAGALQRGIWLGFQPRHPGRLVTSAYAGHTYIWDVRTGRIIRTFRIGGPLALSPDGRFAALAQNRFDDPTNPETGMALLDLRTGAHRMLQGGLNATIATMAFTPDGKTIVAGSAAPSDNNIYLWDLRPGADRGRIMQTFTGQSGAQSALALVQVGPTLTLYSGANDGSIMSWDLAGTQRLGRTVTWGPQWAGCGDSPCVVIDRAGTLMAASRVVDGSTNLVDLRTLQPMGRLVVKDSAGGEAMAFFPDGRTLATGYWRADRDGQFTSGGVKLWNTRTRRAIRTVRLPVFPERIAVSPDGRTLAMLAVNLDGSRNLELWDVATGKRLGSYAAGSGQEMLSDDVAFSPDGREVAVSDTTVKVWDVASRTKLFDLGVEGEYQIAFSPDSRLLAVGTGDGQVMMMDARTGIPSGSPIHAAGAIYGISFSPQDEQLLALSTADLTVSLWDLRSGQRVGTFPTELTGPAGVFLHNGDLVIAYEGHASIWPVDVKSWEDYACQVAGRDLTQDEWSQLLPGRPYQPVCP